MSTLDTMFQNGMKASGAFALGQQLPVEQQTNQANLQSMMLANQSAAQLNPLRAQLMQGQIDQTGAQTANMQAELPGLQANSSMLGTKADIETKTAAAQIAQRLSSLNNQIGVDGVQKMGRDGTIALQASQALSKYPPALHKEVFQKIVEQYGGDPNSPTFKGLYNMPDGQFQKAAATLGQGMVMNSGDYLQKVELTKMDNDSRERQSAGNNRATIEAAKIGADSRVNAAKARVEGMKSTLGIDKTIASLESQKAQNGGVLPPEYEDELNRLKVQQLQTHPTNNVAPQMIGMPTSYDNARSAVTGAAPAGPNNTGAVSAPQGGLKQIGTSGGRPVFEDAQGNRFIK